MRLLSRFILALLLLAAALILALGPRGTPAAPPGSVIVTYWEKWSGHEAAQMQQIVDSFNETVGREKRIYVQYLSITAVDRKTLVATSAGAPPDIAGLWDNNLVPFASRGAIEPLDDLAREHGISDTTYKPIYRKICTYDGKLYALISTPAMVALHYNRHAFLSAADRIRAAGLDPFGVPRTTDELARYAAAIDQIDPQTGKFVRAGHIPMEPNWYINTIPWWFGAKLYDPETGQYHFDDPATIRAYEWMAGFPRRLGKSAISQFNMTSQDFGSPNSPFIAARVAMVMQGPWMANYTYTLRPAMSQVIVPKSIEMLLPRVVREFNYEWAVAPFPPERTELGEIGYASADLLLIPKGARHKREAFEFIAYVQRRDVMERLNSLHCKNSPLADVSDDFERNHPNPYIAVFNRLASSPATAMIAHNRAAQEIGDDQTQTIQSIYLLKQNVPDAMRALQQRTNAKLEQMNRRAALRAVANGAAQ